MKLDINLFSKNKNAISCLKYEIKRLKKLQQDKYVNDEIIESLHCLKYEVRHIKEAMNLNNLSKIENDIDNLKYKVKHLKKYFTEENSVPFNDDERIDNFSEALLCIKYKMKQFKSVQLTQTEQIGEIKQKINNLQNEISKCKNAVKNPVIVNVMPHQNECSSNDEMDSIYGENKQMNDNPFFEAAQLNDDYLHSLSKKMDELDKIFQFIEKNSTINSDIQHYELLKKNKTAHNVTENHSLNKTAHDIEEACRCINHKVKKLKEHVEFSPIVNDILCLKHELNQR